MADKKVINMSTIFASEEKDLARVIKKIQPQIESIVDTALQEEQAFTHFHDIAYVKIRQSVLNAAVRKINEKTANYMLTRNKDHLT